jgi:hypothetical protein
MSTLATLGDLETRLGGPIGDPAVIPDARRDQAQAVLDDTEAAALTEMGITAWVGPVPADVVRVVCARALRELRNPENIRSETIGGYSYSLAGGGDVVVGGFTADERRTLRAYGFRSPLYSVRMGHG